MAPVRRASVVAPLLALVACASPKSSGTVSKTVPSAGPLAASAAASATPGRPDTAPPAAPPSPKAGSYVYRGTVASKPVVFRVHCAGTCSGYYFYEAIGRSLRLKATGANAFDEVVGYRERSRVTGRLSFETPPGGAAWNGTWASGDGARVEPISLASVPRDGHPGVVGRSLVEASARDPACKVAVHSFELLGLADSAMEDRLNTLFSPEALADGHVAIEGRPEEDAPCAGDAGACDESADGLLVLCRAFDGRSGLFLDDDAQVTVLDDRIVSVRNEYGFDGGGAHPSDGVGGLTVDLRDGHVVDARGLLVDPHEEPRWAELVSPRFWSDLGPHADLEVAFGIGLAPKRAAESPAWTDFYLTPTGIALVPQVPEVARSLRHQVQEVPFAKVRRYLRTDGPASHLAVSRP